MKSSTLNTLLVAKSIFRETKHLVNSGDKHSCTAGIILLQDFVELVVLAALDELDKDEESKSFDELLGELKKLKAPIIKSGTIKALNKQRVISKHYGQLSEPASVINYFNTAIAFADTLLEHVVGSKLQDIFLTDILNDGIAKELIKNSISLAEQGDFLSSLLDLRKAFYVSYEYQYCIYDYRQHDQYQPHSFGLLGFGTPNGMKAYHWTKNKAWIESNVRKPLDYIQINHEQLKTDCMEWGVSTADTENFRRLTPDIIETEKGSWHYDYEASFSANELNIENFNYCMDALLDFLLKKQQFDARKKWPKRVNSIVAPPIYIGKPIFNSPFQGAHIINHVKEGYFYTVERVVSGFIPNEKFLYVHLYPQTPSLAFDDNIWGYLLSE